METVHGRSLPRLFVRADEAGTGALLHPIAVLRLAPVLSISGRPKEFATRSGPRAATAEDREETSAPADAATGRRTAGRAAEDRQKPSGAEVDAAARCCNHGTFLQQRFAVERTGRARC